MVRTLLSVSIIALLAACGEPTSTDADDMAAPTPPAGETVAGETDAHNQTADADSATGFITPGASVPEGAERGDDGVPRDDYGRPYDYLFLGRELPGFSGTMLSGPLFSTQELENQWTLIDVWGLWCGDCMADAPYVEELWNEVSGSDELAFLSIHTPPNAQRADEAFGRYGSVEAYFEEKGYSYPTLVDEDASIRDTLGIAWTPTYILVAPDLTVQGFRSELAAAGSDDPVADLLADIEEVKASYKPGAPRPVED